jgi:FkbM family methyltransferase
MLRVLRKIRQYYATLGLVGVVRLLLALLAAKLSGRRLLFWLTKVWGRWPLFKMRVPGMKCPVQLRFGTTDVEVFKQVLLDSEYDFSLPSAPKVIVDAGANIGLSAVYFANKYPSAVIYALEPEESNFKLLEMNVAAYPQIKPLHAALWSEDKQIMLVDPLGGHCGFMTQEETPQKGHQHGFVPAITLDTLMKQKGLKCIDLLKVDIEGAEKEVFESCSTWIGKIGVVMVELHDRYKAGCSEAFFEATKGFQPEVTSVQTVMRLRTVSPT